MRFKSSKLKEEDELIQEEKQGKKEAQKCIFLTYPDTRVRNLWDPRA
jgi:hypothetical protein